MRYSYEMVEAADRVMSDRWMSDFLVEEGRRASELVRKLDSMAERARNARETIRSMCFGPQRYGR